MNNDSSARDVPALAHELKTPLAVICGYAELLLARDDEETRIEGARQILEASARLSALVDNLLINLGAANGAQADRSPLPRATRTRTGSPARILLVDDDDGLRNLVRVTLHAEGFKIVEARDGADALRQIDAYLPDLVVLDWNMPERSGADVLNELQQRGADVPVIVLTVESRPNHRALAAALGATRFLTKPFSPLELLAVVDELLPQRQPQPAG